MPLPPAFMDRLNNDDWFIVGFPRSGFRWIMMLLADLINQKDGQDPSGAYDVNMARELGLPPPAFNGLKFDDVAQDPCRQLGLAWARPALEKRPIYKSHNLSALVSRGNHKLIYLFRPRPQYSSLTIIWHKKKDVIRTRRLMSFAAGKLLPGLSMSVWRWSYIVPRRSAS